MSYDAVIVGSGPNGLAAAITLAQAGLRPLVVERNATIGGGARTAELTLPGFRHDVCSAIHPLGIASSFFRTLPLAEYGLEWILPPVSLAHPLDDGTAVSATRSVEETAAGLGRDATAYRRLFGPLVAQWRAALEDSGCTAALPPPSAALCGLCIALPEPRHAPRTHGLSRGAGAGAFRGDGRSLHPASDTIS